MSRVLILFSSVDGQTRRIAERMAQVLRTGHEVTLRSADAPEAPADLGSHDAVVVGAAIRYGHHAPAIRRLVRAHRPDLEARPGAFFSVCLSAGGPGAKPETARAYLEAFLAETGWRPALTTSFAGALLYTRYNPIIRFLMRMIVGFAGGDTDMSKDYEYTDWAMVERFARAFSERISDAPGRDAAQQPG